MDISCSHCKKTFSMDKAALEFAVKEMNTKNTGRVDITCPSCKKSMMIFRDRIERGLEASKQREAIVLPNSLRVRKDHSTKSESVDGLIKGQNVMVLSTWTEGENVWANLGPERWAAMVYQGNTYMEYTDK